MDSNFEAFASNPRYSPNGLEGEIEIEEMKEAQKIDMETATIAELEAKTPPKKAEEAEPQTDITAMHEKILGVVDTATRVPRDITGGLYKATSNTLSAVVGRENHDAANEWLRESLPDLASFSESFEKGLAPVGAVSGITQELTQFMAPFSLYMKGIGAISAASNIKAGMFTNALIADIITSGTALDPHMERFATMVKSMGVDNKIIGWLADNENETESEGRLKNIIENAGMGTAIAGAFAMAAMTMKGMWRLSKQTAKKVKPKKATPKKKAKPAKKTDEKIEQLIKQE